MGKIDHRFDDKARLALTLATDAAEEAGSAGVNTGHLLIALADERSGKSAQVLSGLGFNTEQAEEHLRAQPPGEPHPTGRLSLSPDVQQVIDLAISKARAEHSLSVNTEHLLLALSEVEKGPGFALLYQNGISRHQIRRSVQEITGKSRAGAQRGMRATASKPSTRVYSTRSSVSPSACTPI